MRAYLIDEISVSDMEKIEAFLKENAITSNLEGLFWMKIPDDLLSPEQFQHRGCRPHVYSLELGPDWFKIELFIRSHEKMQCICPAYCTAQQRTFIINSVHGMLETLDIKT